MHPLRPPGGCIHFVRSPEGKYVKGTRDNGWEWGTLLPETLIVEIGPNTIQTITIPMKDQKKK